MNNEKHEMRTAASMAEFLKIYMIKNKIVWKNIATSYNIPINTIANMGNGAYPRIDTMYKIATGLGITVNDVIYITDKD